MLWTSNYTISRTKAQDRPLNPERLIDMEYNHGGLEDHVPF